jgi:hypothetical protein
LTQHLELVGTARRTQFDGTRWNELVGGLMVHATPKWAFGALHHRREGRSATEFTVRYYY